MTLIRARTDNSSEKIVKYLISRQIKQISYMLKRLRHIILDGLDASLISNILF